MPDKKSEYHGMFPVFDGHVDLLYMMMSSKIDTDFINLSDCHITEDKLLNGNVKIIVSAFYCKDKYNGPAKSVSHFNSILLYSKKFLQSLCHIKNHFDLKKMFCGSKKIGAIFLLENSDSLIDMDINLFIEQGFKVAGLTHAGRNRIADGNSVKHPQGLTYKGKELIKRLERHNIIIDVAHLAEPGFWELISICSGPVISSHTGLKKFCNTPRNLSDEQINIIIEKKGMIGISVNPEMLSINKKADIKDVFNHIDSIVQGSGNADFVGIGSDFGGFNIENQGLNHPGLFGNLAAMFRKHGYPEKLISKIMGKNWHEFYASFI